MAVEYRLSGGQNNTQPNGSLGGQRSDTAITTDVLENLFDNITRQEGLIGRTEFRCFYVYNTGAGHISGATVELTVNPPTGDGTMSIGLDLSGKGDGRNNGIATTIIQEDDVPTSVNFFGEENTNDGAFDTVILPLGLLKSGEGVPVWLKRVTEPASQQTISVTMVITHDAATLPGKTVDDGGAIGELIKVNKVASGQYVIGTARVGLSDL